MRPNFQCVCQDLGRKMKRWGDARKGARPRSLSEGPAQVVEFPTQLTSFFNIQLFWNMRKLFHRSSGVMVNCHYNDKSLTRIRSCVFFFSCVFLLVTCEIGKRDHVLLYHILQRRTDVELVHSGAGSHSELVVGGGSLDQGHVLRILSPQVDCFICPGANLTFNLQNILLKVSASAAQCHRNVLQVCCSYTVKFTARFNGHEYYLN